jgi:hypothetical protein
MTQEGWLKNEASDTRLLHLMRVLVDGSAKVRLLAGTLVNYKSRCDTAGNLPARVSQMVGCENWELFP